MRQKALAFLKELSVTYRLVEHPATFRVEEHPRELEGLPVAKNLLLKDTKTRMTYMVLLIGEKKLDMRLLASALGVSKSRLTFVKYDDVEATVGVKPGHVSVLNLLNDEAKDVRVVFDTALRGHEEIGFHPNVNTASVFMKPDDVLRVIRAAGHEVLEVSL